MDSALDRYFALLLFGLEEEQAERKKGSGDKKGCDDGAVAGVSIGHIEAGD